ncbi:glycosyltransferase family 4 protein [Metabacillus litoralis]|uniref:Glycosyltransferase family 4 protein n=1 Tax=Metabacillus litoralis TaxID=152268 RepID=A0A5C6UWH3_9BACI|nr:glycosyltransferase [Metabacillus litoralis]TXC77014.1 glycosyltransferase family 4 protein [Metabacillus litoralis]
MSKGTIIYIGGFSLPDKNAAAHRVLSNAKILKEIGHKVVFIDIDNQLRYDEKSKITCKKIQDFDCWSIPYPKSNKQWIHYLISIDFFLGVLNHYSDVKAVICYNYQSVAFIKIKNYCIKNNIKIFADCTEWYSTAGNNLIFKIIKGFDSYLRMRIIQKKLDGIIVISRYLENFYKNCKNVVRIPPLVDLSEEKWNHLTSKSILDKVLIVYAGNPGKDKDKLNLVIEGINKLDKMYNFEFYVIGITKKQYLKDYENHKEIIGKLDDKVKFLGRLPHQESLNMVKKANYSMFIRENNRMTKAGFPTKFVESISCGTPVITSKNSDLEEYVTEGENGHFVSGGEGIILKLESILSKENLGELEKSLKSFDYKVFHYKNYVKQFSEFLNKI